MPGFSLFINIPPYINDHPELLHEEMIGAGFHLHRFTVKKFLNDKLFYDGQEAIIVIDGVVLNSDALKLKYQSPEWSACIWKMYREQGTAFVRDLRGSFAGAIYDKIRGKWFVFTDHFTVKPVYYFHDNGRYIFSTDISDIYSCMELQTIQRKIDINAAYMLMSYAYMLTDCTLCTDVKKVLAGCFVEVADDGPKKNTYYRLPQSEVTTDYDEDAIIESLDKKFREAIALQFDKDKEYGYRHFVSLSGGLDSRMVTWIAHMMGYTDQLNFTFSQSEYIDETTPKKIAAALRHEWIFKALDNGLFLKDLDDITRLTGGNIVYYGLAHSYSMYRLINFKSLGVVHSGQIGNFVIGSVLKGLSPDTLNAQIGAYSEKLIGKVAGKDRNYSSFPEKEIDLLYERGFNGTNNGNLSEQQFTEIAAPFYDVDFFEFCLSIPINARLHHNIYKKWVVRKYPQAAAFIWETTNRKVSHKTMYVKVGERKLAVDQIHQSVFRRMGLKKLPSFTRFNMNPLDYWYRTNDDIRRFQDNYFADNIDRVAGMGDLHEICRVHYLGGTAVEKSQVLSLLSAVKLFSLT